MVSMALLTVSLLFIIRAYAVSRDALRRSVDVVKASLLLEEKLWEFESRETIAAGTDSGDFEMPDYSWNLDVRAAQTPGLNQVSLEVFDRGDARAPKYSVLTYLGEEE